MASLAAVSSGLVNRAIITDSVEDALALCRQSAALSRVAEKVQTEILDWNTNLTGKVMGRGNLVLCADVLFLRSSVPKVAAVAKACVKLGGAILLFESVNPLAAEDEFRECLEKQGWGGIRTGTLEYGRGLTAPDFARKATKIAVVFATYGEPTPAVAALGNLIFDILADAAKGELDLSVEDVCQVFDDGPSDSAS